MAPDRIVVALRISISTAVESEPDALQQNSSWNPKGSPNEWSPLAVQVPRRSAAALRTFRQLLSELTAASPSALQLCSSCSPLSSSWTCLFFPVDQAVSLASARDHTEEQNASAGANLVSMRVEAESEPFGGGCPPPSLPDTSRASFGLHSPGASMISRIDAVGGECFGISWQGNSGSTIATAQHHQRPTRSAPQGDPGFTKCQQHQHVQRNRWRVREMPMQSWTMSAAGKVWTQEQETAARLVSEKTCASRRS